ncbi:MAG: ABC transporter permease [Vicinamibacterales bacterium]
MTLRQDAVYAIRALRRTPVFTSTAILSLTIGIGANAAIFSLADALLLRERPGIRDPGRLVDVGRTTRGEGFDNMSYPNFADYRDRNTVFSGLAGYRFSAEPMGLGARDGAERVFGAPVSGNYFEVLGVPMALGRGFLEKEDRAGAGRQVAVLSHRLWRHRFDGARDILGRTIHINGRPFTVVGVTAAGFTGNTFVESDLWIPLSVYPETAGRGPEMLQNRAAVWMVAAGRLEPGVTLDEAHAQMTTIARDLEREHPKENQARGVALVLSHRLPGSMRTSVTAFVGLLFALVGLVLAIACTNVAGMLLARSLARAREIAVRLAVGAGKARIVGQLVTESLLLAIAGGAGGVLLAVWMIRGLRALLPALPVLVALDLRLDWRVVAFSVALAVGTGVVFGLVPAWQAANTDLTTAMKSDGWVTGPRRLRLRQAFVVAQVAMSVLLVVVGLLFARSLMRAGTIDPGFDVTDVDVAGLDFRLAGYEPDTGGRVQEQILARVEQLPAVQAAALAANIPLIGSGLALGPLTRPGQSVDAPDRIRPDWNIVTPRFFHAMRTPLVRGRGFTGADRATSPAVAIVNETFARRAWPGEDPVGKTLEHHGDTKRIVQIVGVARDGKYRWLGEEPRAYIYVPLAQHDWASVTLLVKTEGGRRVASEVREVVRQIDPNLPIVHSATLAETTAIGLLPHRLAGGTAGAFGLVGLVLATIGVYGITAYNVTQRTREIGVRVALGAARPDVLRLVIGQAIRMSATGAIIGLLLAAAATRLLVGLLYGVAPLDAVAFGSGAALFAGLSLAASWWPAHRAASLNPVDALRTE